MEKLNFGLREFKFAQDGEAMTIAGYGAVFGNVDAYGDVIAPGAFAKSLAAHKDAGTSPLMLLEHGGAPLPIGVWDEMSEDGHGLIVKGRFLDTTMGIDAWKAAKAGAITGLSIGFRPTEFELRSKPEDPRRTLKAVDLVEVSLVGMPANSKARTVSVKSATEILTIRELEDALRDAGYSKSDALAIASRFEAKTDRRDSGADAALVAGIDRLLSTIRA